MHIRNIENAIRKSSVKDLREFIFENYFKQIGFTKEDSYFSLTNWKETFILFVTRLTKEISKLGKAI